MLLRPVLAAFFGLFLLNISLFAQNPAEYSASTTPAEPTAPSKEMRGAWVASVANIDWPSKPGLSPEDAQNEFTTMLDDLQKMGINAVFVQVRPAGDAFYPTKLAPWSRFLTGKQGQAPASDWDPLDFMVTETHRRKMEFHAWLNPYRATTDGDLDKLAPNHMAKLQPTWVFKYGSKHFFDPGEPAVRKHVVDVIADIVMRYDVDGIHFDDYFYPYPEKDQSINDWKTYQTYGQSAFSNSADWRRNNVDELIRQCAEKIRSIKPYVRFGVSPFGVWRNSTTDPRGSATRAGVQTYDDLYADVLKWLDKGWIDYVAPQLYWSIGFGPADYSKLVDWWAKNAKGKHVYIGHAAYKIGDPTITKNDPNWGYRDEISRQVHLNRTYPNTVQGSIFFSTRSLLKNPLGVADTLTYALFERKALVPGLAFKSEPPAAPIVCRAKGSPSAIRLAWQVCSNAPTDQPYYFALYKFIGEGLGDFNDPENLLWVSGYNPEKWFFEDQNVQEGEFYTYAVTAFNHYGVESSGSKEVLMKKTKRSARRVGHGWWSKILRR